MVAFGTYRAIWISWMNPVNRDLAAIEVWMSLTNDRSVAVLVGTVAAVTPGAIQRWPHSNIAPGTTAYYWVRAVNRSGVLSGWTPSGVTDGWEGTAADLTPADLPVAMADSGTAGIATFAAGDFNDNGSGLISLDYTNIVPADASNKGMLTATDWLRFNGSTGTATLTLTGVSGSVTVTARYEIQGGHVILYIPYLVGTSTDTTCTITGLPAAITPVRSCYLPCLVRNNGLPVSGFATLTASSTTITLTVVGAAWVGSGDKGLYDAMLTYGLY